MCGVRERKVSRKKKVSIPRRKVSWSPYCEISVRLLNGKVQPSFIRGHPHVIFDFHFHHMRSAFIIPLFIWEFLIFLGPNHISLFYIAPSVMSGTQQMFKHCSWKYKNVSPIFTFLLLLQLQNKAFITISPLKQYVKVVRILWFSCRDIFTCKKQTYPVIEMLIHDHQT